MNLVKQTIKKSILASKEVKELCGLRDMRYL